LLQQSAALSCSILAQHDRGVPPTTRKSVPLTERDLADLELLRRSPSHRRAFCEATGVDPEASEATVLHGLLVFAVARISEQALDEGYAALAASYAVQPDEAAYRAAVRARARGAHGEAAEA
jgi:hypothetical protein